jgi:hypothetical protein
MNSMAHEVSNLGPVGSVEWLASWHTLQASALESIDVEIFLRSDAEAALADRQAEIAGHWWLQAVSDWFSGELKTINASYGPPPPRKKTSWLTLRG